MFAAALLILVTPVHAVYDTFGGVDCDAVTVQYRDAKDHVCVPKVESDRYVNSVITLTNLQRRNSAFGGGV